MKSRLIVAIVVALSFIVMGCGDCVPDKVGTRFVCIN